MKHIDINEQVPTGITLENGNTPSVTEYLQQQQQKNAIKRLPKFELGTQQDIIKIQHHVDRLYAFSYAVTAMLMFLIVMTTVIYIRI